MQWKSPNFNKNPIPVTFSERSRVNYQEIHTQILLHRLNELLIKNHFLLLTTIHIFVIMSRFNIRFQIIATPSITTLIRTLLLAQRIENANIEIRLKIISPDLYFRSTYFLISHPL